MKILPDGEGRSPLVFLELIQRLKIKDIMNRNLITALAGTPLTEIRHIMKEKRITGVPIRSGKRLVGIISIEDIMNALADGYIDESAEKHMSRNVVVLEEDMPLSFAVEAFEKYTHNRFPILNERKELTGIITSRDITLKLLEEMNREFQKLEESLRKETIRELDKLTQRFPVIRHDFSHAGRASTTIKKVLKDAGADSRLVRRISVAAYEMEMNLTVHSLGGELIFITQLDKVELIARDNGPGIADMEGALREGYSTATEWIRSLGFGAGMGLPNIKRVSDDFSIASSPQGTEVHAVFYLSGEEKNENQ